MQSSVTDWQLRPNQLLAHHATLQAQPAGKQASSGGGERTGAHAACECQHPLHAIFTSQAATTVNITELMESLHSVCCTLSLSI